MTSACHFLLFLWGIVLPSAATTDAALSLREPGLGYFGSQGGLRVFEAAFCAHRPRGTMWERNGTGSAVLRYGHGWWTLLTLSRVILENGVIQAPWEHTQVQHLPCFRFFPWHSRWDSITTHSKAKKVWTLRILCSGWSRAIWVQPTHLEEAAIYTPCKALFKTHLFFCGCMHMEVILF